MQGLFRIQLLQLDSLLHCFWIPKQAEQHAETYSDLTRQYWSFVLGRTEGTWKTEISWIFTGEKESEWVFSKSVDYWAGYFGQQFQVQECKILVLGTITIFRSGLLWRKKAFTFPLSSCSPLTKEKTVLAVARKKRQIIPL